MSASTSSPRLLRPDAHRRTAFWLFAALAALLTWAFCLGTAVATVGRLPAVTELWTGMPFVAALVGWMLAALMLPRTLPVAATVPERVRVRAG